MNTPNSQAVAGANKGDADIKDKKEERAPNTLGFDKNLLKVPALTIFALEEPENHLAPHLLARVVNITRSLAESGGAQALMSSHSPALLSRINPEEIRHFHIKASTNTTVVKRLVLPNAPEDAAKYVREAVKAYPEIYFAKFVILAEGPSEEVVIPKLARSSNLELDTCFVCVVPLGGRHVNHFWRLLSDLDIPFVSLLDLDSGREGGGWARIKYACEQLIAIGADPQKLLNIKVEGDSEISITIEELSTLHSRELSMLNDLNPWLRHLESFGVYYSEPLDLDMAMLQRFPKPYMSTADGSPNFPSEPSEKFDLYIQNAIAAVVGDDEKSIALYGDLTPEQKKLFAWYRYLFLNHSKPATHLQAVANLEEKELREKAPEALIRLLATCRAQIPL
jgi:hypothetical protein